MAKYSANDSVYDKVILEVSKLKEDPASSSWPHLKVQCEWLELPEEYRVNLIPEYDNERYLNMLMMHYLSTHEDFEYTNPVTEYGRHPEVDYNDMQNWGVTDVTAVITGWPLTIASVFDDDETWAFKKLCEEQNVDPKNRIELYLKIKDFLEFHAQFDDQFIFEAFFKACPEAVLENNLDEEGNYKCPPESGCESELCWPDANNKEQDEYSEDEYVKEENNDEEEDENDEEFEGLLELFENFNL